MSSYSQQFMRAVNFTLAPKIEGELSMDPDDPGNWTGGEKGKGTLLGTKYGISAAQYPHLDIPLLRKEDAIAIYRRDYWDVIAGDMLPPRLSLAVFDTAVNQGQGTAAKLLQASLGITADGKVGPETIARARTVEPEDTLVEFLSRRAVRYAKSKDFDKDGRGWMARLVRTAMESVR
jgi:lysozyme family protein